jgi:hypothetical protein
MWVKTAICHYFWNIPRKIFENWSVFAPPVKAPGVQVFWNIQFVTLAVRMLHTVLEW